MPTESDFSHRSAWGDKAQYTLYNSKFFTCQVVFVQTRELGILVIICSGSYLICMWKPMFVDKGIGPKIFVDFK